MEVGKGATDVEVGAAGGVYGMAYNCTEEQVLPLVN